MDIKLGGDEARFEGKGRPALGLPLRRPLRQPNALFNFPKLSVWWLRLGVAVKRTAVGRVLKRKSS